MIETTQKSNRISDKTQLLIRFNYVSSLLSFLLGLACYFGLHIKEVVPHVFFAYPIINLANVFAFKKHRNLTVMALVTSSLSFFSTLFISMYSGGIESPFIFVFALIVLAGYVSTSWFGKIYLFIIMSVLGLIFILSLGDYPFIFDAVPIASKKIFSFACILFSVYLLGGVFGKDLLKAHHKLYKSKTEIEKRINEKEMLLREVHHRVKNNLQTVSSLLNLQSRNTEDVQIKTVIKSSQNRVISMAMIHEMLYMRDNLSKIEFRSYVKELGEYLISSLNTSKNTIGLHIDIPQVKLGIDTAIPLGLLINEVITNSMKYGFKEGMEGHIHISLKEEQEGSYELRIRDTGVGFSDTVDLKTSKSLGLKLIHNLARQLKGSIQRDSSDQGTSYIINFQDIGKHFNTLRQ
ncbi:sensor histidine kinase [Spongiimicrobium salis]|uniref:sensor histidine kinase n=1 Tax=Spongiimicrobium salis TaxID=1667022 RepID=UPI00374DD773